MFNHFIATIVGLFGPGDAPSSQPQAIHAVAPQAASDWEIGPIIRGRNYSVGMPLHPIRVGRGWQFDFPYPHQGAGHVHYVTTNPGSLAGKTRIVMRYRVDAARGVRFEPQEVADQPGTVSIYFQRRGDNWTGRGHYEFFRWFSPPQTVHKLQLGEHEMKIDLRDPAWVSVNGRAASSNPAAFAAALSGADQIGVLFGSHGARGHGVYATGPARFTLISLQVL